MYLGLLLAISSPSYMPAAEAYHECVRDFAFKLTRSGDSSEIIVSAAETECWAQQRNLKDAIDLDTRANPDVEKAFRELPRKDVEAVVKETAEKHLEQTREIVRNWVVRDIVLLKAKLTEVEAR